MDKKNDEFREMLVEQHEKKLKRFDRFLDLYEKRTHKQLHIRS